MNLTIKDNNYELYILGLGVKKYSGKYFNRWLYGSKLDIAKIPLEDISGSKVSCFLKAILLDGGYR